MVCTDFTNTIQRLQTPGEDKRDWFHLQRTLETTKEKRAVLSHTVPFCVISSSSSCQRTRGCWTHAGGSLHSVSLFVSWPKDSRVDVMKQKGRGTLPLKCAGLLTSLPHSELSLHLGLRSWQPIRSQCLLPGPWEEAEGEEGWSFCKTSYIIKG